MPRSVRKLKKKKTPQTAAQGATQSGSESRIRISRRQAALTLVVVALGYAFLAGFHTNWDPDMGWHMATGRYVVEHHVVPHTDILSYTSPGAEWIYPPFAGVLYYGIHSVAGYAGLTWFCSLTLLGLVACLLQGPSRPECINAAVLAIFAVPILAHRIVPRPDLFSHLFFAIFLVVLWRFQHSEASGDGARLFRTRLWLLPVLMVLWVNLHPGFIAGLGVILAYLLLEGVELVFPAKRAATVQRLRVAWPPLAATLVATLINPFGYKIFLAAVGLAGLQPASQIRAEMNIAELEKVPMSLPSLAMALDLRNPDSSFWWLAIAAVAVVAMALWQRHYGAALLTAAALYVGFQRHRYNGLFAIVVVVVGATILTEGFRRRDAIGVEAEAGNSRPLPRLAAVGVLAICLLTCVRCIDLASSRAYIVTTSNMMFGAGESSLFPERAADFILREHLPGNIFQAYNLGGFSAWRLGPAYLDFIDGRGVSPAVSNEYWELIHSAPDSLAWQEEIARRGINVLFFPLARNGGLGIPNLNSVCQGRLFRPVYMDEVSIVLLRDSPENRPWLDRLQLDCGTHQFTPPASGSSAELADFWADAGSIELVLGRMGEARWALSRSAALAPEDPSVHLALAQVYISQQQPDAAEHEFKTALALRRDQEVVWYSMARFYVLYQRYADARAPALTAAKVAQHPARAYVLLGQIDLALRDNRRALEDFDRAEQTADTVFPERERQNPALYYQIAEGHAKAYALMGDLNRAAEYQQEANRDRVR